MRHVLTPHPRSPCEAVTRLEVEVERDGDGLALRYLLTGDLNRLVIPARSAPERTDGLWNHTCFEAFVAADGDGYREFNFAPSGAWAAYGFEAYRKGMASVEDIDAPRVQVTTTADALELRVALALPGPVRLGLTAVIEEAGGRLSYWALHHPAERPDFHDAGAFALEV